MIEINQLEQLICIAKEGTISKAAQELYLSQPALSRSMQRLENELDVTLFDHYKNKVVLNSNGELVLKEAEKILASLDQMMIDVKEHDRIHRTFSVATCAPSPLWEIEPLLHDLYPQTKVTTAILEKDKLIQELKKGSYSLVILPEQVKDQDLLSYPFFEEDLSLSLPKNHPLAKRKSVSFKDLEGQTMLLYSDIGFWHDMHVKTMPHTQFLIQSERQTFKEIVKASTLPSFTTNISIKHEGKMPDRIVVPFKDPQAHVHFSLVIQRKEKEKFIKLIESL